VEIVTLDQAKTHLNLSLDVDHFDGDVTLKLAIAHSIVADYLTDSPIFTAAEMDAWDEDTAPGYVVAAVLEQLAELWRWRGDEADGEAPKHEPGFPAPRVRAFLARARMPGIA
jgi:hypothetical protein